MKKSILLTKNLIALAVIAMATLLAVNGMAQVISTLDTLPVRIAMNGNGDLLVSDYTYGQVLTISASNDLTILDELVINGRPLGVAWANGLTYVGNSSSQQVEVYNDIGQQQLVLGFGKVPVATPQDIAIGDGNVYVVDGASKTVKIFEQNGVFKGTIPQTGYNQDILANPTSITIDGEAQGLKIFVSDYGDLSSTKAIHPRIQVFNFDGSLAYTINSGTPNKYRFTMPQGLTVNKNNHLLAIDAQTAEIHVFDAADGTLLSKMKGTGIANGPFAMKLPLDLIIDNSNDNVFVTNSKMASIQVFEGAGGI